MARFGVMGPQGSGKTTQAKLLAEALNLPFIDSGDLVRAKYGDGTPEGENIKQALDNGLFVDDQIAGDLVSKRLAEDDCRNGFVMDGYPRSVHQIEVFDPEYEKVFYLDISDEEAEKRLLSRGREDDTPELIKTRLELYHKKTEEVLKHYQEQNKLVRVDGLGSIEEIQERIQNQI